jgi:GntR family transcriptional regulator / MocR family aminotransferase
VEKSWAISGVDLHLVLSGNWVRAGLEAALREAVQTGRLAPGTRLPSTRALAADLRRDIKGLNLVRAAWLKHYFT